MTRENTMPQRLLTAFLFALFVWTATADSRLNAGELDSREVVQASTAIDLSGRWVGTWTSCSTGHKGPLKAEVCRLSNGDYRFKFRGRFFKVFPFRYSVVLNVVEEGDTVRLKGSSYLGRMFGTFCYSASADACQFRADYTSKKDRGVFSLKKVSP
jgi:hypothetical protein